jgi:hypothetical protein
LIDKLVCFKMMRLRLHDYKNCEYRSRGTAHDALMVPLICAVKFCAVTRMVPLKNINMGMIFEVQKSALTATI